MKKNEYEILRKYVKADLEEEKERTQIKIRQQVDYHIQNFYKRYKDFSVSTTEIEQLVAEMEAFYDTKITESDSIIYGLVNKKPTWWTDIKDRTTNYYWNSFKEYLTNIEKLPEHVQERIEERSDKVLNYLFNPLDSEVKSIKKYGMVIGSVQSGKTANYTAIVCKAADAGFKVIIIIAGTTSILRQQTQIRIDKSFVGKHDVWADEKNKDPLFENEDTVAVYRSRDKEKLQKLMPITLTTEKINGDFNKVSQNKLNPINPHNTTAPLIFVIKKNVKVLDDIVEWTKTQDQSFPLLLIDDEADNASVNTRKDYKNNQTAINKGIRNILEAFPKSAYVGFTATPFANVFIDPLFGNADDAKDLFPKDFIIALKSPDNYWGPEKIFGESCNPNYIIHLAEVGSIKAKEDWEKVFPVKQKKGETYHNVNELPASLKKAIILYVFNIVLRNKRGFSNKHNTMLIHVSRLIDMHEVIAKLVKEYLKKLSNEVRMYYKIPHSAGYSDFIQPLNHLFDENMKHGWNSNPTTFNTSFFDILFDLPGIIDSIEVSTANTNMNGIVYSREHQTNMIAIGGNALARGFTLPGLSISYFIRNTSMCDTLLQMGRWFGYRDSYEDLCRVFIPDDYASNFTEAYLASEDLLDCISKMEESNKSPEDFLITISQHPATRMMLTAKNKMRNVVQDKGVFLDGKIMEKGTYKKDNLKESNYINEVNNFINSLEVPKKASVSNSECYRWLDVPAKKIAKLIETCPKAFNVSIDTDLLIQYVLQNDGFNWRVVIPSVRQSASRKKTDFVWRNTNNTVCVNKMRRNDKCTSEQSYSFSVSDIKSERMGLSESELRPDMSRSDCRKARKNPLLIISIADLYESEDEADEAVIKYGKDFPFFSLSFAGSFNTPVFKPLMNFKYNQAISDKLQEEQIEEDETDDFLNEGENNV